MLCTVTFELLATDFYINEYLISLAMLTFSRSVEYFVKFREVRVRYKKLLLVNVLLALYKVSFVRFRRVLHYNEIERLKNNKRLKS